MSTAQRNDAPLIAVDPSLGEILRLQTIVVLENNHHYFEEILDLGPEAQYALSVIYRDAFAVLDALGWAADADATTVDVPLTAGHVEQLRRRRHDLGATNIDRLDTHDRRMPGLGMGEIHGVLDADRTAAQGLDRLIAAYDQAAQV